MHITRADARESTAVNIFTHVKQVKHIAIKYPGKRVAASVPNANPSRPFKIMFAK